MGKCTFFPSEITVLLARNREIKTKNTATESTLAQGRMESPNPSKVALKPPQGEKPPFNTASFLPVTLWFIRGFC